MDDPSGGPPLGSVFISYSSKDRDRVAVIADALRAMGIEVWWDREIPVATTYHEHIKKQLDAAQAAVVVWSPASVVSQYVLWEAQKAHRRGILVPVIIEESDLPPDFFLIQGADLTRWRGNTADPEWKRLTGALSRLATPQSAEVATPVPVAVPTAPTKRAASRPSAPTRPPRTKAVPPSSGMATAPKPWYRSMPGLVALGAAGLLAVVVAVIAISGGGTDPTTTLAVGTTVGASTITPPSTTAAPITTTTVPPTTIAPPPVPDLVWSRIWSEGSEVLGGPGDQKMMGLVFWDCGFVAVGEDTTPLGDEGGAAWLSADGSIWEKVAGNGDLEGTMHGITAQRRGLVADRLVAVGWLPGPEGAGVWTSTDCTTWEQVPYDPEVFGGSGAPRMLAVAAADPGFVAVGEAGGSGMVWTSADGVTWVRVDEDFGSGVITSVVAGSPSGIVAAGRTESTNGDWDAAVWTSDDGLTWEQVDSPAFGEDGDQWINAVTTGGPGLVAVGGEDSAGDGDIDAAVWTSIDGHEWTRVNDGAVFGSEGLQEMFGAAAGDLGLFAVGSDAGGDWDAAVWTSSDGTTWEQVVVTRTEDDPGIFDAGQMQAVIVTDAGVVGVGIIAWGSGEVTEGQPIGTGEETDAVGWVGLFAGTE